MAPPLLLNVIHVRNAQLNAMHLVAMHTIASCSSAASLLATGEWQECDDEVLERWAQMTKQVLEQAQELATMGQFWSERAKSARRFAIMLGRPVAPESTNCVEWSGVPPHCCLSPPIYTGSWSMASTVAQRPGVVEQVVPAPDSNAMQPDLLPTPPRFDYVPPQHNDFACQTVNLVNSPWWHRVTNEPISLPPRQHEPDR